MAGTAVGTLATAAPSSATPNLAAGPPVPVKSSLAPRLPAGAVRSGVLAASQTLTVEVTLNLRNQAGLNALLGGLANQGSPYYRHFLTPAQFTADFGPTAQQVGDVEAALRAAGLSPGQAAADNLSIPVTATAAQLEHAFSITLATYRVNGSRVAYANTAAPVVSSAIAPLVQGIIGLNDLFPAHSMAQPLPGTFTKASAGAGTSPAVASASPAATGPKPCAIVSRVPDSVSMTTLANFYGLNSLYALNDLGKGARVAILELEPNVHSDIGTFEHCYGISTPVSYHEIDGGATGDPTQSIETPLDIETVAALAPDVAIDVYQGPNGNGGGPHTGFYDIFKAFVTANTDKVLSVSWGSCEAQSSSGDMQAQEALFQQANAQGQTILAAAGDNGSTDCYNADPQNPDLDATLSPNDAASLPYVVSVGGTKVNTTAHSEIVWNESSRSEGAGGGGVSNFADNTAPGTSGWCMPAYQDQRAIPGLISSRSKPDSSSCPAGFYRQSPDIAADADPLTGYAIFVALGGNGGWLSVGGTSGATPLWAAIAALTDVSPYCSGYGSGNAGVLPQALYAAVAGAHAYVYGRSTEVLYDVKSGNNDYTQSGYRGGLYPATAGYDLATGLGTPVVEGLSGGRASTYFPGYTALICRQLATRKLSVTSVSPSAGAAGTAVKVTIHGGGFLPVAGADLVREYQGSTLLATLTASCNISACTVTLPKETARTVTLAVSVEASANSKALTFTYASAPHITSIAPASGTHLGGNTVTLNGTNFIGVNAVSVNGKGAHAVATGTTALAVTVPAGTKGATVKVVVITAGGTSNSVNYLYT